ncbi:MAG: DNA topoisomerase IV subunit A [Mycoplasmataceae bacterium]|nr:DNA topoisomerase IV subunit A [Mycoplasmataceae bacterium]
MSNFLFKKENIISKDIDELIGKKFGDYSKYIIQERALPDLRDGLKPVQRRILFAMNDLKLSHKGPYKKSARVIGDVIGKYHPHGDSSVYEAMVRLGQEWKINLPLVDMHGNKGSVDGDSPAAMRYTEVRLGHITQFLLINIDKNLVDFAPNFDDSEKEPVVLPAQFPNLLINGSTGIASGYSTNIPPHNFNEVMKALIYVLKNERAVLSDLTRIIKGPDFPTGGIIQDQQAIKAAYKNGKGKIIVKSIWHWNKSKSEIQITEIPYETNKADLVRKIDDLVRSGKLPKVLQIRDDSDRKGMQITLMCQSDVNLEVIMKYLFKVTDLQKNYNLNMVAIKDKKPMQLGLVEIISSFKEFLISTTIRLYEFELNKITNRLEIVDGLIKVTKIIDKVIYVIRNSTNKLEAKTNLMGQFLFSSRQAEAIVSLRLYHLTSTDVKHLQEEQFDLLNKSKNYKKALKNHKYLVEQIIINLEAITDIFQIPRKSQIDNNIELLDINEEDLIQEEDVIVVVSHQGYIKKVPIRSYEASQGVSAGKRVDDLIISISRVSNLENLVLFSSTGKYYSVPIWKMSEYKWKDLGEHFSKFAKISSTDRILKVATLKDFQKSGTIVISTEKGMIKQTKIKELVISSTKKGLQYVKLKPNDFVVSISLAKKQSDYVTSITKFGYALRYNLNSVPISKTTASGVVNLKLSDNDFVVSCLVSPSKEVSNDKSQIIIITDNGKAKRFRTSEIKKVSRASRGSLISPQIESNPHQVLNAFNTHEVDYLSLLTHKNEHKMLAPKSNIPLTEHKTGLNGFLKEPIKLVFNDLRLKFENLKKSEITKEIVLNLNKELESTTEIATILEEV